MPAAPSFQCLVCASNLSAYANQPAKKRRREKNTHTILFIFRLSTVICLKYFCLCIGIFGNCSLRPKISSWSSRDLMVNNFVGNRVIYMLKDSKWEFTFCKLINFYEDVGGCLDEQTSTRASGLIILSKRYCTMCLSEGSRKDRELWEENCKPGKWNACNNKQ